MDREILHSDLNNFYAAVECLENPCLRMSPIAVTGDAKLRHGIVLAKNILAKECGVQTGDTLIEARKKCADIKFVRANLQKYKRYSLKVRDIYSRYTDLIEDFGIDECWLDVTASRKIFGSPQEIAQRIRKDVKTEIGITVSIGVSWNKVFAKLGSDIKKPDAVTLITKENYKNTVWRLPIKKLLYVGAATEKILNALGVVTIGDLANYPPELLNAKLGKRGGVLHMFANGLEYSPVIAKNHKREAKSVSSSSTAPHDLTNINECKALIFALSENVCAHLRQDGLNCGGVCVSVRDKNLKYYSAQRRLNFNFNASAVIAQTAIEIFNGIYRLQVPVRSIGVTAFALSGANTGQLSFLEQSPFPLKKLENLDAAVEKMREKYGNCSLCRGIILNHSEIALIDKPIKVLP